MGGKPVNPSDGSAIAGLSGVLRCRDDDTGQLQREQELRAGKYLGIERFFDRNGKLSKERSVNERGNSQGRVREIWPNGQLKRESLADDGDTHGLVSSFAQNGQPESVRFVLERQELFVLEYNAQGQMTALQCPPASVTREDRKPCGFEGRTDTTLYDSHGHKLALRTYEQGLLLAATRWQGDGTLEARQLFDGGRRVQRRYSAQGTTSDKSVLREERVFEPDANALNATRGLLHSLKLWGANGQLTEAHHYVGGHEVALQRWFLNGKLPERRALVGTGDQARVLRESFSDAGVLLRRDRFLAGADDADRPIGAQQTFHGDGTLASEETWSPADASGRTRLVARKSWDESGRLTADDDILEDGSRQPRARTLGS
ncbi:MAG: hypothetical protein ABI135_07360 [Rhodoferax sp.]